MMKLVASFLLSAVVLIITGCASIVSKSQYPVTINSNPSGATFTIKNKHGVEIQKGITPVTLPLAASAGFFSPEMYSVEFRKEGCNPSAASLSAGMDGWYVGNILFGGLIGWLIVDPATGAMWKLDNTVCGNLPVESDPITLEPLMDTTQIALSSSKQHESVESVATKLKQIKELKDSGVLTEDEYELKRKTLVGKL